MRLALNPRARRLLRRVPRTTIYSAMELLLLSLLAIQCARLAWAFVTPVDPVGQWRSSAFRAPAGASTALLGSFDPFFRLSGNAPAVVTSLNLKLFGVSENRASGRGSAIIEVAGQQKSFAVGEEIMPGVRLAAVGFDNVTVDRGGTMEQLFLDQSAPATVVAPGSVQAVPVTPPPMTMAPPPVITPTAAPAPSLANEISAQPRMEGGRVTGVTVTPNGSGELFRTSGLQPGDVVVAVNGAPILSIDQAQGLAGQLSGGGDVTAVVERGGQPVTVRLRRRQ